MYKFTHVAYLVVVLRSHVSLGRARSRTHTHTHPRLCMCARDIIVLCPSPFQQLPKRMGIEKTREMCAHAACKCWTSERERTAQSSTTPHTHCCNGKTLRKSEKSHNRMLYAVWVEIAGNAINVSHVFVNVTRSRLVKTRPNENTGWHSILQRISTAKRMPMHGQIEQHADEQHTHTHIHVNTCKCSSTTAQIIRWQNSFAERELWVELVSNRQLITFFS